MHTRLGLLLLMSVGPLGISGCIPTSQSPSGALFCRSLADINSCKEEKCAWDAVNGCLSPDYSQCTSATSTSVCSEIKTCVWNEEKESCHSPSLCSSYSGSTCQATQGCVLDPKNGCLSKRASLCGSASEQAVCQELGCDWSGSGCARRKYFCTEFDYWNCPVGCQPCALSCESIFSDCLY